MGHGATDALIAVLKCVFKSFKRKTHHLVLSQHTLVVPSLSATHREENVVGGGSGGGVEG